jgi:hypothetical protein
MEAGLMTPIDPPPGLLDKVAEAIAGGKERAALLAVRNPGELVNAHRDARAAWDAVAEGLGLRGRHITDHEIGYFDEDGNAILQYGGTLHQCEDVLARHPNWFHPDAKILVKQWMFLQSSPEGEWRTVGEPHP